MSNEQWGHGYYKGFQKGLEARVNFYDFITVLYNNADSPFGDLCGDIVNDKNYPQSTNNRNEILNYLYSVNACDQAINTFNEIFDIWERKVKK